MWAVLSQQIFCQLFMAIILLEEHQNGMRKKKFPFLPYISQSQWKSLLPVWALLSTVQLHTYRKTKPNNYWGDWELRGACLEGGGLLAKRSPKTGSTKKTVLVLICPFCRSYMEWQIRVELGFSIFALILLKRGLLLTHAHAQLLFHPLFP